MRLLFAEDEKDLNRLVTHKLAAEGYKVDSCFDGRAAMDYLAVRDYGVVVLDVMMPEADGFEVLSFLRSQGKQTPVLFLTARDSIEDKVRGLDSGANDYLVKPFLLAELLARIRVLGRTSFKSCSHLLEAADLSMDCTARRVFRAGVEIELSPREYALLECLLLHKGAVVSRAAIEEHVWGQERLGTTNAVDVYISCLRKKMDDGFDRRLLHTVRGQGYALRDEG